MATLKQWLRIDAPAGWAGVLVRSVNVLVVAFVVLQLKEWFDAHTFDTAAVSVDSALIATGTFLFSVLLMRAKP